MARFLAVLCIAIAICLPAQAAKVYKYTDENGNTVFTDEPVKGSEEMDVKPVATIPAIPVPKSEPAPSKEAEFEYSKVEITQPAHEENFINNQGTVTVQVAIAPNLRPGDAIQLYFNGVPQSKPGKTTNFPFNNLDRGEYITHAVIFDKAGKQVGKSEPVTFFVRRSAIKAP